MEKEMGQKKGHVKTDGELVDDVLKEDENKAEEAEGSQALDKVKRLEAEVSEIQKKLA